VVQEELLSELWNYAPLLQKYSNELEMYWDEALQDLESNSKDIFINYLNNFSPTSVKELIFYYYFLYSGCFYLHIKYLNQTYLEFGKKIEIIINPLLKHSKFLWNSLEIYAIFPSKSEKMIGEIFAKEFFPFVRKMVLNDILFLKRNIYDYLENTIEFIEKKSKIYLEKNIPVTLTHFKFENLDRYLCYLGNIGSYNFILEIDSYIRSRLKKRDILIILSYNSFLVMSIGARKEIISERFKDVYIEIKSLVLDYHIYIESLLTLDDSVKEILQKLKI
jgi:hypothetical protein